MRHVPKHLSDAARGTPMMLRAPVTPYRTLPGGEQQKESGTPLGRECCRLRSLNQKATAQRGIHLPCRHVVVVDLPLRISSCFPIGRQDDGFGFGRRRWWQLKEIVGYHQLWLKAASKGRQKHYSKDGWPGFSCTFAQARYVGMFKAGRRTVFSPWATDSQKQD